MFIIILIIALLALYLGFGFLLHLADEAHQLDVDLKQDRDVE